MNKATVLLKKAYYAFNTRNINAALSIMHHEVTWPTGLHEGIVKGHHELSTYWAGQWQMSHPEIEPISYSPDGSNKISAKVRQVVRDLHDNIISDEIVEHSYTLKDGLIASMSISAAN